MSATPPQGKRVSESEIVLLHSPMPDETNNAGHMHGGHLLKLIDHAGGIVAHRHARARVVTASVERMDFLTPIIPGELILLKASINITGKSSMEVGVRIEAENLDTGATRHAATCYMTFVAVDGDDKPIPVPPLIIESEIERRRYLKAQERRRYRNMLRGTVNNLHLHVAPERYAICACPADSRPSLGALLRPKGLVLSVSGVSPDVLCPGLDVCSGNLQDTDPELTARLSDSISLVIKEAGLPLLPPGAQIDAGWRCLALYGPSVLLSHTGIIANLSGTLSNANVSTFFISTFNGNFLLLKDELLEAAATALRDRGYVLVM